jgi:hypothetical protein
MSDSEPFRVRLRDEPNNLTTDKMLFDSKRISITIVASKIKRGNKKEWCPGAESNHRHGDFQSPALPTELPGHFDCLEASARCRILESAY